MNQDLNLRFPIVERTRCHQGSSYKHTRKEKCSIYITICVWAAVYRNVAEDSARNRLHPGTQSDVEGELQRLEPFKNVLRDLQRWALDIEHIWRRSG